MLPPTYNRENIHALFHKELLIFVYCTMYKISVVDQFSNGSIVITELPSSSNLAICEKCVTRVVKINKLLELVQVIKFCRIDIAQKIPFINKTVV